MICLDTNAVIALINKTSEPLRDRLDSANRRGETVAVSPIVLYELRYGAAKSNRRKWSSGLVDGFLAGPVSLLSFEAEDAADAGDIRATLERKGAPIGPHDILIAAQARRRSALLVTANSGEFGRVPKLRTANWLA